MYRAVRTQFIVLQKCFNKKQHICSSLTYPPPQPVCNSIFIQSLSSRNFSLIFPLKCIFTWLPFWIRYFCSSYTPAPPIHPQTLYVHFCCLPVFPHLMRHEHLPCLIPSNSSSAPFLFSPLHLFSFLSPNRHAPFRSPLPPNQSHSLSSNFHLHLLFYPFVLFCLFSWLPF
jgi:hypothetical protein